MVVTFFIAMMFMTFIFANVWALAVWEKRDNFPLIVYWITVFWQIISFAVSVPHHKDDTIIRDLIFFNFTQSEAIVALVGLTIGFITFILIFFDYEWYDDIREAKTRIGERWRAAFPPKEIKIIATTPPKKVKTSEALDLLNELKR